MKKTVSKSLYNDMMNTPLSKCKEIIEKLIEKYGPDARHVVQIRFGDCIASYIEYEREETEEEKKQREKAISEQEKFERQQYLRLREKYGDK